MYACTIHVRMHICMFLFICRSAYTYMHMSMYMCRYMYMYTYMYMYMHMYVYIHAYIYTHTCIHINMSIYVHTCSFICLFISLARNDPLRTLYRGPRQQEGIVAARGLSLWETLRLNAETSSGRRYGLPQGHGSSTRAFTGGHNRIHV